MNDKVSLGCGFAGPIQRNANIGQPQFLVRNVKHPRCALRVQQAGIGHGIRQGTITAPKQWCCHQQPCRAPMHEVLRLHRPNPWDHLSLGVFGGHRCYSQKLVTAPDNRRQDRLQLRQWTANMFSRIQDRFPVGVCKTPGKVRPIPKPPGTRSILRASPHQTNTAFLRLVGFREKVGIEPPFMQEHVAGVEVTAAPDLQPVINIGQRCDWPLLCFECATTVRAICSDDCIAPARHIAARSTSTGMTMPMVFGVNQRLHIRAIRCKNRCNPQSVIAFCRVGVLRADQSRRTIPVHRNTQRSARTGTRRFGPSHDVDSAVIVAPRPCRRINNIPTFASLALPVEQIPHFPRVQNLRNTRAVKTDADHPRYHISFKECHKRGPRVLPDRSRATHAARVIAQGNQRI